MRRTLAPLFAAAMLVAAVAAPAHGADATVARQIDAGHTGFAQGGSLDRPPLSTRWSRDLGSYQSYPLISGGRVFVSHKEPDKSSGTLSALDTLSGATLWSRPIGSSAQLAYDDGRVYALDSGGRATAVDAATGDSLWTRVVREPFDATAPVAADGVLYVSLAWSGGALYALDGATGETKWTNTALWDGGSPAVDGKNVYVHDDYYCSTAAVDRASGATRWSVGFDCWLGGSNVAANGGFVFTGAGQLLDAGTGTMRDGMYGGTPAAAGSTLLQLNGQVLQARNIRTGVTSWEFKGDGKLGGAPVVVNHVAYIGSASGTLFAVDVHTGAQVWSSVVGAASCTSYCYESPPAVGQPGMAVGEGLLLVPAGGKLVALEDAAVLPTPGLDLEITAGPDAPTADDGATFEYAASGAGFTYACRLDRSAWLPCSGSSSFDGLGNGPHVFEVKTVAAGVDVALAARSWSVTGQPRTRITAAPPTVSTSSSASFTLSRTNAVATECRIDGGAWTACGTGASYSYLTNGEHVFEARSKGGDGSVEDPPVAHRWSIDATVPETTLASGPSGTVASREASLTFSSNESGARFECSLDGDPFTRCTSPARYEDLEDGQHRFRVRAADAAGNVDATPAERTWTVEVAAPRPDTSIDSGPATRTRSARASFTFSSPASGAVFECRLDDGGWLPCGSSHEVTVDEGTHVLDVRARNDAGADPSPASWAWTVDATPPETTIDGAASGAWGESGQRIAFTASESGARFRCRLDGGTWDACTSPVTYGSLPPGQHVFQVVARDTLGNEDGSPAVWSFTVASADVTDAPADDAGSNADSPQTASGVPQSRTNAEPQADLTPPGADVLEVAPAPATPRAFVRSVADALAAVPAADVAANRTLLFPFSAPGAGVLRVELVSGGVRVARGSQRFTTAAPGLVSIRLTAAGRKLLARGKRVVVVTRATWTPARGGAVRRSSVRTRARSR